MELLTDDAVLEVAKSAAGDDVEVLQWHTESFAANFCLMRSLQISIKKDNHPSTLNFMVKHTSGDSDIFTAYRQRAFNKEIFFYQTLAPLLNEELEKAGAEPLNVPKCYYASSTADAALLVLEDLRSRGFRSSKFLVDVPHATLLVREAAKLHAASLLLAQRDPQPLNERFPLLVESWTLGKEHRTPFETYVHVGTTVMAEQFCTSDHLRELRQWLERVAPHSLQLLMRQLELMPHAAVITHADLHTRNVLFRYDDAGNPVEVVLLDLQVVRVASPIADLSYFTHMCILPAQRTSVLPQTLDAYHDTLRSLLDKTSVPLPFTRAQLEDEMTTSRLGLLYTILLLPVAVKAINAGSFKKEKENEEETSSEGTEGKHGEQDAGAEADEANESMTEITNRGHLEEIRELLVETAEYAFSLKVHEEFADFEAHLWREEVKM
ncbi:EcKinase 17 [Hyalella azteca]|uniref:EcKinase 17 n=1 Tax=Hyalella azteca TaxID=294128 RepID=A0A6A0GVV8_HYAAZ|nr:uncharacterized protein LOC108665022 [Hyalella azteca]KAA0189998.1 EcKinase 17 [Hyalella azteca]